MNDCPRQNPAYRLLIVLAILTSSIAHADVKPDKYIGVFKVILEARAQHEYEVAKDHSIRTGLGLRWDTILDNDPLKQVLYFVPQIGYEYKNWNLGPEVRIPLADSGFPYDKAPWKFLMRLQLKLPDF